MKIIDMQLTHKSYKIYIENGLINKIAALIPSQYKTGKIMIVTDSNVAKYYLCTLREQLKDCNVMDIVIPAGESSKCLSRATEIYQLLSEKGFSRTDLIIALGGGVIGDLAGFVASTYMRGVDFIQIPTSLLAQVDSSIGGKVAVDIPTGKNLVGAFYQPTAVYIDPEVLATLPERYYYDGLAEVIKYACIKDKDFFVLLSKLISRFDIQKSVEDIITKCLLIKKYYVEQDERDTGIRMFLNFGHTIGHALEKHYKFTQYTHGEAVAIGMHTITVATEKMGLTEKGTAASLQNVLKQYKLPYEMPKNDAEFVDDIINAIGVDKKNLNKKLNLVLLESIGESFIKKIELSDIKNYLYCGDNIC